MTRAKASLAGLAVGLSICAAVEALRLTRPLPELRPEGLLVKPGEWTYHYGYGVPGRADQMNADVMSPATYPVMRWAILEVKSDGVRHTFLRGSPDVRPLDSWFQHIGSWGSVSGISIGHGKQWWAKKWRLPE